MIGKKIVGPVSWVVKNMRSRSAVLILVLPLFVRVLAAEPVTTLATFTGGIFGTWDFTFTSGPADLQLLQITIDLSPTDLRFDTAPGGVFGSLTSLDIGDYQGTDVSTGLYGILPGTGADLDNGQLLTFQFDDFTAGETFHFTGDVDNPNPTLTSLNTCSGRPLAVALCNVRNALITAQNDARLLAAALVTSEEFAGAQVTYTFGGPGFYTSEFPPGEFESAGGVRDVSSSEDDVQATPEPATFVSLAAGVLLLGCLRRRRAH